MRIFKTFICFFLLIILSLSDEVLASDNVQIFQGYITNKIYKPLKLKVFELDKDSLFTIEKNLEDNSYIPNLNLKITAENALDYSLTVNDENIFIPKSTKFSGYISEIEPPKSFNRRGFYRVTFENAICPDGQNIYLKPNITSKSKGETYNPLQHLGKTTLGLLGGSLAGTLFTYQLGGLGLALASHGYSLAAGAALGGFIGTVSGVASTGKSPTIEPGSDLIIAPLDEISFEQLKQITCKSIEEENLVTEPQKADLKILSVKEKKDFSGETAFKIKVEFTNNSNENYRLGNFFLRDSQGKEYNTSFINADDEIFTDFPPKQTKIATLEFFVEHPKASHWIVLKNKTFNEEIGSWEIIPIH